MMWPLTGPRYSSSRWARRSNGLWPTSTKMSSGEVDMVRISLVAAIIALFMTGPVMAETRIGVVDLRQALFSSEGAQAFSERLQQDFSGEESEVREAQEEARKLQQRLEQDGAMMNESARDRITAQF